jgi:hypothetical protein
MPIGLGHDRVGPESHSGASETTRNGAVAGPQTKAGHIMRK